MVHVYVNIEKQELIIEVDTPNGRIFYACAKTVLESRYC
jgi:hypothetical protein